MIRKIGTPMYEISVNGTTWTRHINKIRDSIHPITEKTDASVVNSLPNIPTPSV